MRRLQIILIISITLLFMNMTSFNIYASNKFTTDAKSGIAIDEKSGQIIWEKNDKQVLPVGSISKLLSVYVVEDKMVEHHLKLSDKIVINKQEAQLSRNSLTTDMPLKDKHAYSIKDLLIRALIKSSNASMLALANSIAGNQNNFVKLMEIKAKRLGIKDVRLVNSNGLPNTKFFKNNYNEHKKNMISNKLSAEDIGIISRNLILHYPSILSITSKSDFSLDGSDIKSTNEMLPGGNFCDKKFKVKGLKTGTTVRAGSCFVAITNIKRHNVITVLLGTNNNDDRFEQTDRLFNYINSHYVVHHGIWKHNK